MPPNETRIVTGVAPGRVNFIGEHVDYNGGRCLPFALTRTTSARVGRREDGRLRITSGDQSWEGTAGDLDGAPTWALYVAGVVVQLGVQEGLEIEIRSDVPVGAGLSSSAALECSTAVAIDALLGLGRTAEDLESVCVAAESENVGAPTGGLDQAISIHGEAEHALLIDFGSGDREQVPFAPGEQDLGVLVIDTKVSHELTDGGYGSRRDEAWAAARELGVQHLAQADLEQVQELAEPRRRRARHVVTEVIRVDETVAALRAHDWAAVGPLLDASHASLRDDYEVSCDELDVAVEAARSAGAAGARMTGGGFGGSAIALVPLDRVDDVRTAVAEAFRSRDWDRPDFFLAEPGAGARLAD